MRLPRKTDRKKGIVKIVDVKRVPDDSGAVPQPSAHRHSLTVEIYNILCEERPLHRRDLLDRVRSLGIYVGGENPMNTFGAYLSQDKRFVSVGKGVWTLVEEPPARSPNGAVGRCANWRRQPRTRSSKRRGTSRRAYVAGDC